MRLKGPYFECNMVTAVAEILKKWGEIWFPLNMCVLKEEEHRMVGTINVKGEHSDESAEWCICVVCGSKTEGDL